MRIKPLIEPRNTSLPTAKTEAQVSARERAIQALMRNQVDAPPVKDATRVQPEEMSVVKSTESVEQDDQKQESEQQLTQNNNSEEDSTSSSESTEQSPVAETQGNEQKVSTDETTTDQKSLSSQYALLARKEKALRLRDQQLKAREEALKQQEQVFKAPQTQEKQFDEKSVVSKDRLMKDPFSVLTELGLTYDQLTELALNGPRPETIAAQNDIRTLQEELRAVKAELENTKKSFEETKTDTYKQAIAQITRDVNSLVKNNPQFETVATTEAQSDVVELIEKTYKEDGILLTAEEAAQMVEDYLVDEAIKIARIKKIQQKLQPTSASSKPTSQVAQKTVDQSKQSQIKTLTNSIGSSRKLTARERAIAAMEGKLTK